MQPQTHVRMSLSRLRESFARPTDALPLDFFRVLAGILVFAYFVRTLLEAKDFSNPDGLIDHELTRELFWYTRISLFPPNLSLAALQTIFLIACLCSLGLIVGYRVKICAAILYVIAVCTYRWNFLVMYVDDSIMHLVLLWMLLLPVGRTLVLQEYLTDRKGAWQRWKYQLVPGSAFRLFLCNLTLIYVTAGLWKWTSPMWRDGTALYAVLKLPISHAPDFWGPQHLPVLKLFSYAALVLEPAFPLLFVLRRGHPLKYALLLGLLAFHVGSVATLQIPFANLACAATTALIFGGELMRWIRGEPPEREVFNPGRSIGYAGAAGFVVVALLSLAMISSVSLAHWRTPTRRDKSALRSALIPTAVTNSPEAPEDEIDPGGDEGLRTLQWSFFSALWCVGLAQQYQLFNWIDDRNFEIRYHTIEYQGASDGDPSAREVNASSVLLPSTRGMALRLYLHGITWMRIPRERQAELRHSLQIRLARSYCQKLNPRANVAIYATAHRIDPGVIRDAEDLELLMRFRCNNDEPEMISMNLDP